MTALLRRGEEARSSAASSSRAAILALALLPIPRPLPSVAVHPPQTRNRTENVVLVIADGIRPREVFEGVDVDLVDASQRAELWSEDPHERRRKLMPFFWSEVGRRGLVLGNRALSSPVSVKNRAHLPASGYAEILTGEPQESVDNDAPGFSSRATILEFVHGKLGAPTDVAAFASWEPFARLAMQKNGDVVLNAGYQPISPAFRTPEMELVEAIEHETMTPWESLRHDGFTVRLSLDYLERYEPKFLVVAVGEMEAWMVEGRYDRTIKAIQLFDDGLRRLWDAIQSRPGYRDRTTLLITSTHGHGLTRSDWTAHGPDVRGGEETWLAILGPDTPARGEARGTKATFQSNVAATILELLDLDFQELNQNADPPIEAAIRER